jgi:hypothetical protein
MSMKRNLHVEWTWDIELDEGQLRYVAGLAGLKGPEEVTAYDVLSYWFEQDSELGRDVRTTATAEFMEDPTDETN